MIFCHYLTEVEVAVNFFDLPSIDVDIHFVNYMLAHDFSLSQVHIETYWFDCFMNSFTIICSSEVDLAIRTMPSMKIKWDRCSPFILIPLLFQLILPMTASCRHDVKNLGEVVSTCLYTSLQPEFLTICV